MKPEKKGKGTKINVAKMKAVKRGFRRQPLLYKKEKKERRKEKREAFGPQLPLTNQGSVLNYNQNKK